MGTYEKTAAQRESGYLGYIVVAASFCSHLFLYGITWSVGVFYMIFLEELKSGRTETAWIGSINTATLYMTGPLSSFLVNKFGSRRVAMLGGFIASVGLVLSSQAATVYHLYFTFGLLTGFGLGLAFVPSVVILAQHYTLHLNLVSGIACSGVGLGTFVYPPLIRILNETYGWRGAILLLGAITLNITVCAALFIPPKREDPSMPLDKSLQSLSEAAREPTTLNLDIFANRDYVILCANNFLLCFGLSVVYVHLASFASTTIDLSNDSATMLFSVMGIMTLVGRVFYGIIGQNKNISGLSLYTISILLAGLWVEAAPFLKTYAGMVSFTASFGFLTACFGTLLPGIIVSFLDSSLLSSGYGYLLVFEALGTLVGAPAAGWVLEATERYAASFYTGGTFLMASSVIMFIPWLCNRHRRTEVTAPYISKNEKDEPLLVEYYVTTV